jgi:hypothetical protein
MFTYVCVAGIALLFANCVLNFTQKGLGVIARLDLASQQHQEAALTILRKAIKICLNLSANPVMQSKQLQIYTQLRAMY